MKQYFYPIFFVITGFSIIFLGIDIFKTGEFVSYHYHVIADYEGTEIIFGPILMLIGGAFFFYGLYEIYRILHKKI